MTNGEQARAARFLQSNAAASCLTNSGTVPPREVDLVFKTGRTKKRVS
jgi:hypothetical protein